MDNLILKTVNFLFVPEAALAVFFLIIFIILCIYGYLKVRKCKSFINELEQNIEAEFDRYKDKYNPHTFISVKLAAISGIENEVIQIPNIFVSIGILATFLGLGVAIQSAAALLKSNTVELAKLNDVLGIIAFKFQTSVWGIMFSLLFQKMLVNTYFEYKEKIISAMHEKLYEKVKAGIHKTLDEQNGLLVQQIELQKETQNLTKEHMDNFAAMMQADLNSFANIMQQSFDKLNQTMQDNFSNYNNSMNNSMQKFLNLTEDYRAISEQFTQNVNDFADKANAQNKLRSQQLVEFKNNLEVQKNYLDGQMEKFIQNLQDTQEKANESNRDAVLSFNESVKAMEQRFIYNENEYAKQTQDRLGEVLDKHLRMISDETIGQCRAVSKTVDRLGEALDKHLQMLSDKTAGQCGAVSKTVDRLGEALDKHLQMLSDETAGQCGAVSKTVAVLDDTISNAVNMLKASVNAADEKISSLQNVVVDFKETQKQLLEDSASISDNNTKLVASINETQLRNEKLCQDILGEIRLLLQAQQACNKEIQKQLLEDSASIGDSNTKLVASINKAQLRNEKLCKDIFEEVKLLLQTQQACNKDLLINIVEKQKEISGKLDKKSNLGSDIK